MNLVSGNIRFVGIFAGVPPGGGVKWQLGCHRRQFFGDLCGYCFGNVRDKSGSITWWYTTPCLPVVDCKINDLEWPWVPISRQNPFSNQQGCRALTFALARLSCIYRRQLNIHSSITLQIVQIVQISTTLQHCENFLVEHSFSPTTQLEQQLVYNALLAVVGIRTMHCKLTAVRTDCCSHLWFKFFNFGALPIFLHYITSKCNK